MRQHTADALWRVVWAMTVSKRKLADLAFALDPSRRTL